MNNSNCDGNCTVISLMVCDLQKFGPLIFIAKGYWYLPWYSPKHYSLLRAKKQVTTNRTCYHIACHTWRLLQSSYTDEIMIRCIWLTDWLTDKQTNKQTKCREKSSSWEAESSSAHEETPQILRNTQFSTIFKTACPLSLFLIQINNQCNPIPLL